MAVDKLVDSNQLDANLTSVANAIRAKGGTSDSLVFPAGFIDAIDAIPTGGGGDYVASDWFDMAKPTGAVSFSGNSFNNSAIRERTGITSVSIPNVTTIASSFYGCTELTSVYAPLLGTVTGADAFRSTKIEYAVFPSLKRINSNGFLLNTSLKAADFGGEAEGIGLGASVFSGCTQMNLLILRGSVVWPLNNVNTFNNSPFASGKAGGTLFVPSALISSYRSATNWSTILGYANNSIQAIEGSQYENYYVDGTQIS